MRRKAGTGSGARPAVRSLPLAACLALLVLVAAGAPAGSQDPPPGVIGPDDRRPVEPGAWPWTSIGRVNIAGQRARRMCTGTLVGPRHVLTAAHCLVHPAAGRILPHAIHFVAGYRRGEFLAHSVGERVVCGAGLGFTADCAGREAGWKPHDDWAIVVLRDALGLRPVPLAAEAPGPRNVARAGYGFDRAHLLSVHAECRLSRLPVLEPLMGHDCDATEGDSGSPLLVGSGDETAVAAVNVGYFRRGDDTQGVAIGTAAFDRALDRLLKD